MKKLALVLLLLSILAMAAPASPAPASAGNPPGQKNCWEEENFKVCIDLEAGLPFVVRQEVDFVHLSWQYWDGRPNIIETEPGLPDLILFMEDDGYLQESFSQGVWLPADGWLPIGESPAETAYLLFQKFWSKFFS